MMAKLFRDKLWDSVTPNLLEVRSLIEYAEALENQIRDKQESEEQAREERMGNLIPYYTINLDDATGAKSLTCHRCGRTSHNQNDITYKFCGNCKAHLDGAFTPMDALRWFKEGKKAP